MHDLDPDIDHLDGLLLGAQVANILIHCYFVVFCFR